MAGAKKLDFSEQDESPFADVDMLVLSLWSEDLASTTLLGEIVVLR